MNAKLERLKENLVCPDCFEALSYSKNSAECLRCELTYPIINEKLYFIKSPERNDHLDDLKGNLKKVLGKYYYLVGIHIVAPTFPFLFSRAVLKHIDPTKKLVVEIGCGSEKIHPNAIGLDLYGYSAVDIVCDLEKLPFKKGSVDAFVSRSVLEHLHKNWQIVEHLKEATKAGGLQIHSVPFMFPFHSSPHDFYRFTHRGLESLFESWSKEEQFNPTGPVTLLLVSLTEFLSILCSFGSQKLKSLLYLLFCALLFPIKFLDIFFVRRKAFLTMAPTIFTVFKKPN